MEPEPTANANTNTDEVEWSMFQLKYVEFVEDALGALPEYHVKLEAARALTPKVRLERFQAEVKQASGVSDEKESNESKNPGTILPGVTLSDEVWNALSEGTRHAICEHVRVLSICCFMESGTMGSKPEWMDDMMKDIKDKLESVDMDSFIKKFSTFFAESTGSDEATGSAGATGSAEATGSAGATGSADEKETDTQTDKDNRKDKEKEPAFSLPKLPERFLKGQLAKLAQEIVKDITPEDLGISQDMVAECEKNPSKAFTLLFSTFTKQPDLLQKTIAKIGKRLQQKIASGAIRPQEIAKEAEEMMKEFSGNSSFVEMMAGLKGAFGMEDMDMARSAGRESSARLAMVRDRLRKKLDKRQAASTPAPAPAPASSASSVSSVSSGPSGKQPMKPKSKK